MSTAAYEAVDLVEVDLTEVTATGGSWVDCPFSNGRFTGAVFTRTKLTGCTLSGGDVPGTASRTSAPSRPHPL